jgi:hypothetical protein
VERLKLHKHISLFVVCLAGRGLTEGTEDVILCSVYAGGHGYTLGT